MNMKKTSIAITFAVLLSACATATRQKEPVSSLRFNYVTSGGRELGLVRAFDDGAHTALQFNVDLPHELQIFDTKGQLLAYQRVGQTVVLPDLYSPLLVQVGQRAATVEATLQQDQTKNSQTSTLIPVEKMTEIARLRAELQQANATIAQMRETGHSHKVRKEPAKQLQPIQNRH